MENTTEAQAILNAGAAISENVRVLKDGSIPFTIVPDGYQVSSLENMLVQPVLKRGTVQKQQQMAEDKELPQRELAQWTEITATLPSLIDGYDYARVIDMLRDMRFESAEVQSALEGRRYLYQQAQSFLTQLFAYLPELGGYSGRLVRTEGSSVMGKMISAKAQSVEIQQERGVITLPLDTFTAQTLIDAGQYFASLTTDSTDFYRRQELIAAFARVAGLPNISATVAAQLMEQNRAFRSRWMKPMRTARVETAIFSTGIRRWWSSNKLAQAC